MEVKIEKVLDSAERCTGFLRRKRSSHDVGCLQSSQCCSKNNCNQHYFWTSLPRSYSNFMKSDLPQRLLFHEDGEWKDHPVLVINLIQEDFQVKKAITEVAFEGHHLLFDFVHMIQIDRETGLHKPLAWIDKNANCFCPEVHPCCCELDLCSTIAEDEKHASSLPNEPCEIKLKLEVPTSPAESSATVESRVCSSTKKIKTEEEHNTWIMEHAEMHGMREGFGENEPSSFFPLNNSAFDFFHGKISPLVDGGKAYTTVQKLLLLGMSRFIDADDIVEICSIPPISSLWQMRLKLFQNKVEMTTRYRGNANVRFAWLPSSRKTAEEVMLQGPGKIKKPNFKPMYGTGIHLNPATHSNISVRYSDVDEKGLVHLVLCRVILGNLERVYPGSKQFQPSSVSYDNGMDDFQNPNHYIIWETNADTHILPEYVVSFMLRSKAKEKLLGRESISAISGKTDPSSFISKLQGHSCNINSENYQALSNSMRLSREKTCFHARTPTVPTSPWMPISMLFAAISTKVSHHDMERANVYYDAFKRKRMTRMDLIKKLRQIIGDKLLISTIMHLQNKLPSDPIARCEPSKDMTPKTSK